MNTRKLKAGLAILAGGLSFVGNSSAVDLILNGSFENNGAVSFGTVANWTGNFSTYNYSQQYTTPISLPASEDAGNYYSWSQGAAFGIGGWDGFTTPTNELDHLQFNLQLAGSQTVNLTNALTGTAIDAGQGRFQFSSWLASYQGDGSNPEQPYVVLRFFNDTETVQMGDNVIFDRTTNILAVSYANGFPNNPPPADLTTDHDWVKYAVTNTVPVGARKAKVYLLRSPKTGKKNAADTYVDLVKLDVINTNDLFTPPPSISLPPVSQTASYGNSVTFTAGAIGAPPLGYQWRHAGTNLAGSTTTSLTIPLVQFTDAGLYTIVVTNSGGATTSSPPATLTVINPSVFVTGQWDFKDGNLVASCGRALEYFDGTVAGDTTFGTTTSLGISDIAGQPANVMHFTPSSFPWGGFVMPHGASPNGGGTNVNQYTLIFDVYYPGSAISTWGSFLQTGITNETDGDLFVRPQGDGGGIGISSTYHGTVSLEDWHRIAFAIDLSGPGAFPILTKFIDGVKVGQQTGLSGVDGRFSLSPTALLFADEDGDARETYVSSIQFSNGRRPDAFIAALGGATASKIPGCISAKVEGGSLVIRWTGGVPLEGADELTGPWSIVSSSSPYSAPGPLTKKFYRPKIP